MKGPGKVDFKSAFLLAVPDPQKPHTVVYAAAGAIAAIILGLHWLDAVAGWVSTVIVQLLQLLSGVFIVVTVQEFEDRMAREPVEVVKLINPMRRVSTICRFFQVLQYIQLWRFLFPVVFMLPAAVFDLSPYAVPRIEPTRLWKECQALKTESKYRLAYDVTMFFLVMAYMLYNLIFGLK